MKEIFHYSKLNLGKTKPKTKEEYVEYRKKKVKVILICGNDRSGSTLFDLFLGQFENFFPVGEIRHIWDWGVGENLLCGCGDKFNDCNFWNKVIEETFGSYEKISKSNLRKLWLSVDHGRYLPQLVYTKYYPSFKKNLNEYSKILNNLYKAISKVSGCTIIIDSSKKPSHGFIVNKLKDIDLRLVHLVRDSRAVAYSWKKKRYRPEKYPEKELMATKNSIRSAFSWNLRNCMCHALNCVNDNYAILRYEDFAISPGENISKIISQLGVSDNCIQNIDSKKFSLMYNHTVAGNPMRFKRKGDIKIDTEWRFKMKKKDRLIVTFLTLPLLRKYRYLGSVNQ